MVGKCILDMPPILGWVPLKQTDLEMRIHEQVILKRCAPEETGKKMGNRTGKRNKSNMRVISGQVFREGSFSLMLRRNCGG